MFEGKTFSTAAGFGMYVEFWFENMALCVNDGVIARYAENSAQLPQKYQLLAEFSDGTYLAFSVAMYGGILAFSDLPDNFYYLTAKKSVSPLCAEFDKSYFEGLLSGLKKDLSAKAFLATEQRIPGLGNGCVQDILFNAKLNPKKKMSTVTDERLNALFHSVKSTLQIMTEQGGRDTERNLFGIAGGYRTLLSKNTYGGPCPVCGGEIIKESYLGGAVYYCPNCQPLT